MPSEQAKRAAVAGGVFLAGCRRPYVERDIGALAEIIDGEFAELRAENARLRESNGVLHRRLKELRERADGD